MLTAVAPFLISLLIAVISIPAIIKVADLKHLMDEPDEDRKVHSTRTPTLGGIAIFAGTVFAFSFFNDYLFAADDIRFMTSGLILLFFAGIKDDILLLTPIKKLMVQVISAVLITVLGKLHITNLWGMFHILEIPPIFGIVLTTVIIVAVINAFNLIDGLNGLAGGLGVIASLFFGLWFYLTNSTALTILSFSLAGSLVGFLFFNFPKGRIFMGDTGSMIVGFIISILAIKFIENNRIHGIEDSAYYIKAAPAVAIGAILIALVDLVRLFFQRLITLSSPFKADRRHIHHIMIDTGLSHCTTTLLLWFIQILIIALSLYFKPSRSMDLFLILLGFQLMITSLFVFLRNYKNQQT